MMPLALNFQFLSQGVHDPLLIRELAGFEFGVDELAIDRDLETPASGWNEFQILDLLLVGVQELARQTDGLGFVISHRAVFEFHVHDGSSQKCDC